MCQKLPLKNNARSYVSIFLPIVLVAKTSLSSFFSCTSLLSSPTCNCESLWRLRWFTFIVRWYKNLPHLVVLHRGLISLGINVIRFSFWSCIYSFLILSFVLCFAFRVAIFFFPIWWISIFIRISFFFTIFYTFQKKRWKINSLSLSLCEMFNALPYTTSSTFSFHKIHCKHIWGEGFDILFFTFYIFALIVLTVCL